MVVSYMDSRKILTKTIFFMVFVSVASVVIVLTEALGPSARERANIVNVELSSIEPGQVKLVGNNFPVYVVAQTNEMLNDLGLMSDHVWDRRISTEYKTLTGDKYFIFYAVRKDVPSCLPKHYPKNKPNTYRTDEATWLGGFWDMCRDLSYDYAGRAIEDIQYSYINFSRKMPNLPPVMGLRDDGARLSFYDGVR